MGNKKPQRQKVGNRALYDAMQEKRRSNAAQPHRNRAKYYRPQAKRWNEDA